MEREILYYSRVTENWYVWICNGCYKISSELANEVIEQERLVIMPDNKYEDGQFINYGIANNTVEK